MDNFKRPKRLNKHMALDGIITRNSPNSPRNINLKRGDSSVGDRSGAKRIGDFKRPEGFAPSALSASAQPRIGAERPLTQLSSAPRNRSNISGDQVPEKRRRWFRRRRKDNKHNTGSRKRTILRAAAVLGVLVVFIGGFLFWKLVYNTSKVFDGNILDIFDSTKLKGEDKGRVNILLTGTSEDNPGHNGADLTDSIMVISLDTNNKGGFIMSIPRDLWVDYGTRDCSFGFTGKINAVYKCGEEIGFNEKGYSKGGLGLLEKVIERDFGIDLNYYVKINYTAFRDAVNAVGGVDFTVATSDPRGIYDGNIAKVDGGPLKLSAGKHKLDGQTALNLSRARCDTVCYGIDRGDFDRSDNQRKLLLALKDKALSLGVLSNPAKISSLLDAVGKNVKTDFKTNEIRRLRDLASEIQNHKITSVGLADENVKLVRTGPVNGLSAVMPVAGLDDFSEIQAFMKRLTSNDPVIKEGATIVILNASGRSGLAQTKSKELKNAKGFSIKAVANAGKPRTANVIVALKSNKPNTKTYLEEYFSASATTDTVNNEDAQDYEVDFVIILGSNAAPNN